MRDYGEAYIKEYRPPLQHIKLIRSMRVCRSPALGGKAYSCKKCGHTHYVYFGCGQSSCSICQSVKREQWLEKMSKELLKVPYVHLITTMPHQLNSLSRKYPSMMYSMLLRVTAQTVQEIGSDVQVLGAKLGLISVLHTFGSDMKYHVHVHSLMTFGGIDKEGKWKYPLRKGQLCRHRRFRVAYKHNFLKALDALIDRGELELTEVQKTSLEEVRKKAWSFHATPPTLETGTIELYLSRYINRVATTNSRLKYLKASRSMQITYNDYRQQESGKAAPKALKEYPALSFIHQYMKHVPPPYFQKTRRYGLHSSAVKKKYEAQISGQLKRNGKTIRTIMEIITKLLKLPVLVCEKCKNATFVETLIRSDKEYIQSYLRRTQVRAP